MSRLLSGTTGFLPVTGRLRHVHPTLCPPQLSSWRGTPPISPVWAGERGGRGGAGRGAAALRVSEMGAPIWPCLPDTEMMCLQITRVFRRSSSIFNLSLISRKPSTSHGFAAPLYLDYLFSNQP